jgi:hypothetical protein
VRTVFEGLVFTAKHNNDGWRAAAGTVVTVEKLVKIAALSGHKKFALLQLPAHVLVQISN